MTRERCPMCNHFDCEGCCKDCNDPNCYYNQGCKECSKGAKPLGVQEAERLRANGNAEESSPSVEGGSSAANAAPAVPSFAVRLLSQHMDRLRTTVRSA